MAKLAESKNPLELVVTKSIVGVLETNIEQLEAYVNAKLEEYNPELYNGDADMARKDRAELNNSKKFLTNARISLIKDLMKPYEDFEIRCKGLEKKIATASSLLDEIVKVKESEEKQRRRESIEGLWKLKNFNLVSLDKIFNPKWLNKTTKESVVSEEMDAKIESIYKDLKTIEQFADDKETLKAHYLTCLSIGDTLDYGEELKKKRELVQKESEGRTEREHEQKIDKQKREVALEALEITKKNNNADMVSEALGFDTKTTVLKEYVISVKTTEEQLLKLKAACNALGVEYSIEELTF